MASVERRRASARPTTVLVVDDEAEIGFRRAGDLTAAGFAASFVPPNDEAAVLARIRETMPDVIVLDRNFGVTNQRGGDILAGKIGRQCRGCMRNGEPYAPHVVMYTKQWTFYYGHLLQEDFVQDVVPRDPDLRGDPNLIALLRTWDSKRRAALREPDLVRKPRFQGKVLIGADEAERGGYECDLGTAQCVSRVVTPTPMPPQVLEFHGYQALTFQILADRLGEPCSEGYLLDQLSRHELKTKNNLVNYLREIRAKLADHGLDAKTILPDQGKPAIGSDGFYVMWGIKLPSPPD